MGLESIFRAYDVRGEVPGEIDAGVMERIGKAFGTVLRDNGEEEAVIGRDVRDSSPELMEALIRGLVTTGVEVEKVGLVPYGALLSHSRKEEKASAYVTASHLSPGNNGVKFAHPDGTGYKEEENARVEEVFREGEFLEGDGGEVETDILEDYRQNLLGYIDIGALDVILDPGNGAASVAAPDIFWGAEVTLEVMNGDPDGSFPNRLSDVTEESLNELREEMSEGEHDVGFAYDGDADRFAVIDDEGRLLSAEETAYIALEQLLDEEEGPVVANVECSRLIEDIADEHGRDVIRTRVGHSYVFSEVIERGAVLGVETSRHMCIAPMNPVDDGIAASVYLASAISQMEDSLSEKVDRIPGYTRDRTSFQVEEESKFDVVDRLQEELSEQYEDTNTKDGIRVELEKGWVLIRASNTSPLVRLTVEAETEEGFEDLKEEFSSEIRDRIDQISD
ncbi:MAG: hypothetical protein MUP63_01995 [Candidatus Nanohaloarchaeota archaeon QJJ-7]|nr:hypothetical protein [Candidatus Nanohaloarchaeota archaeon QJJ-7]